VFTSLNARIRYRCFLVVLLFSLLFPGLATAQQSSAAIDGVVRDSGGKPIPGVAVVLQPETGSNLKTETNSGGNFRFSPIPAGRYTVHVKKTGFAEVEPDVIELTLGQKKHCEFALKSSVMASTGLTSPIKLDDTPNFTVAGVTDATGAGGHGSETRLRTGEALARETVNLNRADSRQPSADADFVAREAALQQGWKQNPASFQTNHELGELYFHAGRYQQAIPLLDTAYDANPHDHGNAVDFVSALTASGDIKQARDRVDQILHREKLPGNEEADFHRLLGDIDEKGNDPLGAVREYEQAARLDPSEPNYFGWGSELLLHRAATPAIEVFSRGTRLHPGSARMLAGWGAALFTSGSADEAAQRLCQAADLEPNNPEPYLFLGKMQEGTSAALPCPQQKLARFAELEPQNALANYYYGLALWKANRGSQDVKGLDRAQALLEKSTQIDSKLDVAFVQLGNLQFARGAVPEAIAVYERAIAANPDSSDAHYRLGLAYKRIHEDDKAEKEFDLFKHLEKSETEEIERQRRELRQFLFVLKDQANAHSTAAKDSSASGQNTPK
jgi:tetratricopeptide (TPR) repeat protein